MFATIGILQLHSLKKPMSSSRRSLAATAPPLAAISAYGQRAAGVDGRSIVAVDARQESVFANVHQQLFVVRQQRMDTAIDRTLLEDEVGASPLDVSATVIREELAAVSPGPAAGLLNH